MNKIKCECGHVNPEGTVLCESCGKPVEGNQHIDGNQDSKLLNMRYDGSARRSQTYKKSIVDKIWSFFSSVKVGVWLIVIALVASIFGTIFPQEEFIPQNAVSRDPAIFYEDRYGILGLIYYQLGFHNLYSSWWYMVLIALIGISLVICSLDRFVPLFRALRNQSAKKHVKFLSRQRLYSETDQVSKEEIDQLASNLKKSRYKLTYDNGHILAEKGRFSRWGPYVNHIGLIIILLAALLRTTPLMFSEEYIWIREGEQMVIPGTDGQYYIKNEQFVMETHDPEDERFQEAILKEGEIPSNFQSDVIIYEAKSTDIPGAEPELEEQSRQSIRMNEPAKFDGYTLYQSGYQVNEFESFTFKIHETDDENESALTTFSIDLSEPQSTYELDNGFRVEVTNYFPDYVMTEEGNPVSQTNHPRNPAFVLTLFPPESETGEVSFLGIGKNIDATGENDYKISMEDFELRDASGLTLNADRTLPFFIVGAAIFMIGVIQGMYWQHRRVWIHPTENGVFLAGHTNKNWFGVKKDIEKSLEGTSIKMVNDQQELEE
ncbi:MULTISPECIES: cytochrome c biogenesis protein ResB [Oceanobacillus]|uniref:Cytochrome c biogenesis protein n=1 Tax=Oceanobacillus kimchii TaxID=746691 RepID=A0ABQ5TL47_9BACI|nr:MULTISPECIES: cytochrome c biogenesis protein ResB [Oceanobacillus]MBT2598427.1 cytochrome c biogenesis protein ResB [Oceanobacillus sp. ISL-74]MBT2651345.1 cytochrome c biogenesis protein ResB [Oceanobacillus sp. ISL-73]MCT1576004.1 cytochrome c biogenesis protein ResB [Oceanobacillus kimchii]MCT2135641.1 cytochrome c biogenesis protein ResB [Oceanobacillus kimchii]OEH55741.1 cytochrome C biogenesis protein [Oceanobacillus sp. E9]